MSKRVLSFGISVVFFAAVLAGLHLMRETGQGRAEASVGEVDSRAGLSEDRPDRLNLTDIRRKISHDSDALIGLSGETLSEIFEAPEFVRAEFPTVIWQYRNDECVLNVYFTAASDDVGKSPVVHYDVRSRSAKHKSEIDARMRGSCVSDMAQGDNMISFMNISPFYKSAQ